MLEKLTAANIGSHAQARLASGGYFRVLATHGRSVYLAFDDGLICVGDRTIGRGPINLLVGGGPVRWDERWRPGRRGWVDGSEIVLNDARLRWSDCPVWSGRIEPRDICPTTARWTAEAIERAARRSGTVKSSLFYSGQQTVPGVCAETARRLQEGRDALGAWLATDPPDPPPVAGLLGLGPGLTPSGDDVLVGSLIALALLGADRPRRALATAVSSAAPARTSRVSYEHLRVAAAGAASDRWYELGLAIERRRDLAQPIAAVAAIGHSSGWDALAGFHTVFRSIGYGELAACRQTSTVIVS